ncbi:MAG TPA: CapA family protein [Clostridiaceae bacterium]|nr:CapA family protein [Clostridiaceae bacterium]
MKKYYKTILVFLAVFVLLISGCKDRKNVNESSSSTNGTTKTGEVAPSFNTEPSPEPSSENGAENQDSEENNHIEEKKPERISIMAVGDIMCHESNLIGAFDEKEGIYDFKGFFEYVKPYISEVDFAIANLETTIGGEQAVFTGYPEFNTPDSMLEALKDAGVDILLTANNHSLDRGKNGLVRTIEKIREYEMLHTGTWTEKGQRFTTTDVKGFKISTLVYTYGLNGNDWKLTKEELSYMVNLIDEAKIKEDILKSKEIGSDITIVCMHWGIEYQREPSKEQVELAKKIFEWGADVVIGFHPHVIQRSEIVDVNGEDRYLIYSMGNFISNFRREDQGERVNKVFTEDGVMVRLEFEKRPPEDGGGVVLKKVEHIPTWVDKFYVEEDLQYRIIPIPDDILDEDFINDRNREKVLGSYKNTMDVVQDYLFEEKANEN